jgi:hypothetical protein
VPLGRFGRHESHGAIRGAEVDADAVAVHFLIIIRDFSFSESTEVCLGCSHLLMESLLWDFPADGKGDRWFQGAEIKERGHGCPDRERHWPAKHANPRE